MSLPAPFDAFVEPARARPALWRLALGLVLVVAASFGLLVAIETAAWSALDADLHARLFDRATARAHPAGTLLVLGSFVAPLLAVPLAAFLVHGRRPGSLIGPPGRAARDFARAAGAAAAVAAAYLLLWSLAFDSEPGLRPALWALYALPAMALIAVQTGAEELLFRGYLQTQLAARFRSPLAWAVLPSLAFGALHWDPALPWATAAMIVATTAAFGLIAADLTARTGTLGAAWGLHFANNVAAIALVAPPGLLSGLALRLTPYGEADAIMLPVLAADLAALGATWLACRWALSRPDRRARPGRLQNPEPLLRSMDAPGAPLGAADPEDPPRA